MLEFFNELMDCFQVFVTMFLDKLIFSNGVTIGWILVAIACFYIVIRFFLGRMK